MAAGPLLCAAWYYTILAGFYVLYCPVLYIMFINHNLYRVLVDTLFALWELYPVALFQCCYNTELHHYGDYVKPDENTIMVFNHRTRIDWNYIWISLYHATHDQNNVDICTCKGNRISKTKENSILDKISGGKSKIKFILKDELKGVPGLGWIMQLNYFLYVKRNWQEDQLNLSQFIDYYARMGSRYRLILFPEGTDLSEDNKRRSEKYALANNLSLYTYVLHPRTTGWATLCSKLRESGLQSVYDVTIAYDTPAQTEFELLRGHLPNHVYFHFKRYSIEQVPRDETDLRTWLNQRWSEKENNLKHFYNNGKFIDSTFGRNPIERTPRNMNVALAGFVFWSVVDMLFAYTLITSVYFQFWVLYHTLLFVFVTKCFGGFQNIQYKLLDKFKI